MKELTIEEKAKAYDEALKYAMIYYKEGNEDMKTMTKTCFPVLVEESGDESIRKALIRYHKSTIDIDGIKGDEIVSWLEKQGEKIDAIENFGTEFEKQVSHLIASAINKEHEYNQGYVKWTANALLNYAKQELEKQDEQKSVINVPKFKAGDTIRLKNSYVEYTIESVADGHYYGKGFSIAIAGGDRDYELVEHKIENKAKSKFKVGDRIRYKHDGYNRYKIYGVGTDYYVNGFGQRMDMSYTDANFELIEDVTE